MKLKITWQQNRRYVSGEQKITYEYMDTPFGRVTIEMSGDTGRYEEPYDLCIPGNDSRSFSTREKAKAFAEDYIRTAITKLIDTTPCTSNT